jgi:dGTPase
MGLKAGTDKEKDAQLTERALAWLSTMDGHPGPPEATGAPLRTAHLGACRLDAVPPVLDRCAREEMEDEMLAAGATRARGAGRRASQEEPDDWRTCFERDRDRILHCTAFRRLAGKTQVFIFPADHQRSRLTHALEVAQIAVAIARAGRLNVALAEAIALGHDCGHGPGGHASEDALGRFVPGGFDHAVWGADVTAGGLNLCAETLDGIRNHSWSRPAPATAEGEAVSLADRIAYTAHDFEDAVSAGLVSPAELPETVRSRCGPSRSSQISAFVSDVVTAIASHGVVALSEPMAEALSAFRSFNHERIYLRGASLEQSRRVVDMLGALVEHFAANPSEAPDGYSSEQSFAGDRLLAAVAYVAGMTDRFACAQAVARLGWPADRLPQGTG